MHDSEDYRHIREDHEAPRPKGLDALLDAYLSLRRALGFRAKRPGGTLRYLLRFLRKHGVVSPEQVDRRLAETWLRIGSPRGRTVMERLVSARGFFRYLLHRGVVRENVWDFFPSPRCERFIPYIFSLDELRAILGHLRLHKHGSWKTHPGATYHVLFHTVYACGLRAGEACRLDIGDVDFKRSLFVIRWTKFGKTRLAPFNQRTRELVEEYLKKLRPRGDGMPPEAPLFLSFRKRRFRSGVISDHFRLTCRRVGVWRPKRIAGNTIYGGSTLHALRHTFAVHRLLKWYEEGADVNAKLPLLATYMGHVNYHHTQKYLTVLPRFIDIAGKLFAGGFEGPLRDLE